MHADRQATEKKRPQAEKILLPPAARLKNEERPSRSEQKTVSTTQNNRLTGKAPYKFESFSLQRGVRCEPEFSGRIPLMVNQVRQMIAAPYDTAWKLCAKLRRAMVKHRGREDAAGRVCRGCGRKGRTASRHGAQAIRTPLFCRSVAQFTGHGGGRAYLSLRSATRHIEITLGS